MRMDISDFQETWGGAFSRFNYAALVDWYLMRNENVYISGSQPGVHVPQGVCEKSQGVLEIQVLCHVEHNLLVKNS